MATIYVNPNTGNDAGSGTQAAPFKTITRALKQATAGATIQLADGNYTVASGEVFPLDIPQNVALVGNVANKGANTIINGSGIFVSPTVSRQNITLNMKNGAAVSGVTITNEATRGTGVWFESTNGSINNCTLTKSKREGVFATGVANPVIANNVFVDNIGNGLAMAGNCKGEVKANKFQRTGYGLSLQDKAAPLVTNNEITENRSGIVLSGEAKPVFRNNRIINNIQMGLSMISSSLPDLGSAQDAGGNVFTGNGIYDLQNATAFQLISVGNQLNPTKIQGLVSLEANTIPTPGPSPVPTPGPSPVPTPGPSPVPTPGISPTPGPSPTPGTLNDVVGHWAEPFIRGLVNLGVVKGFPDGTFRPNNKLTRAEYAALLAMAFDITPKRDPMRFKDVPDNFWGKSAIETVNRGGFMSGYPDTTFRPNQNLTREQTLVSLVNGLQLTGSGGTNILTVYGDRAQISSYATNGAAIATEKKLVVNYPNKDRLEPARDITRAEVSAIVYQVLVLQGRLPAINSSYIV